MPEEVRACRKSSKPSNPVQQSQHLDAMVDMGKLTIAPHVRISGFTGSRSGLDQRGSW